MSLDGQLNGQENNLSNFYISLSGTTGDYETSSEFHRDLGDLQDHYIEKLSSCSLTFINQDNAQPGVDEERFDEGTMLKVQDALLNVGLTALQTRAAIDSMLRSGILFRERVLIAD